MQKFYVTTAIAYVNAPPHIGFALELMQADALARYHRLIGDDTYFLTGVDEHGVKIYETAKEEGTPTQEFADQNAEKFQKLKEILNLSNDDFIRTTSSRHKAGAQKIWSAMAKKGDIYKAKYSGKYCVGCEAFYSDKDLDAEGNCPIHKKKPVVLEEENWFFKLSEYSDQIKKLIESDKLKVVPESRKNEMLKIIGEGLKDVSFSRPKKVLPWGIDVPEDDSQVMYVWCDALSNYITAIDYENEGKLFKKFWPCDLHIIGKDILRFHAGIWIGMLLSAEVAIPKSIFVHGFITSEGQKMSKSVGNVVDPLEYVEKYGVDSLRYYLLREIPAASDGDFSHGHFVNLYNSELANSLGNLVNRVVMMTDRYLEGKVPDCKKDADFGGKLGDFVKSYHDGFSKLEINAACVAIVGLVDFGNKYIDDKKPWAMAKNGDEELANVLFNLLELLRVLTLLMIPILPQAAEKVAAQLGLKMEDLKFDSKEGLKIGSKIEKADPLFKRIEE